MKKYFVLALLAGLCTCVIHTEASAQRRFGNGNGADSATIEKRKEMRQQMRARFDSLSPEQKKQFRQQMKSRLDTLSPQKKKELRKELQQKYKNMTPEEKQQLKQDIMNRADSSGTKPRRRRGQVQN